MLSYLARARALARALALVLCLVFDLLGPVLYLYLFIYYQDFPQILYLFISRTSHKSSCRERPVGNSRFYFDMCVLN